MFSIRYRYLVMVGLGVYSFLNTLVVESFEHYPLVTDKSVVFIVFLLVTAGIWEGNRLWDNYISTLQIRSFWKRISFNFAGSIVITFLVAMFLGSIASYYTISQRWQDWLLPMKLLLMFSFRVNLFLNTIHIIFLYNQQLEKSHQELETYKKISSQAQLQSLKNQVNPHFLFNNLSVLSALIPMDANASVEFVGQFSNVYRYVLRSHEKEIVALGEELKFIDSYIYLLKTRFETGLDVQVDIPEACFSAYIVPVSLQMLVENAVKHNVISKHKPLSIHIYSRDEASVTITNNLQLKTVEGDYASGIGLFNIASRYEFLGKEGFKIENGPDAFSVTIPLIRIIAHAARSGQAQI